MNVNKKLVRDHVFSSRSHNAILWECKFCAIPLYIQYLPFIILI